MCHIKYSILEFKHLLIGTTIDLQAVGLEKIYKELGISEEYYPEILNGIRALLEEDDDTCDIIEEVLKIRMIKFNTPLIDELYFFLGYLVSKMMQFEKMLKSYVFKMKNLALSKQLQNNEITRERFDTQIKEYKYKLDNKSNLKNYVDHLNPINKEFSSKFYNEENENIRKRYEKLTKIRNEIIHELFPKELTQELSAATIDNNDKIIDFINKLRIYIFIFCAENIFLTAKVNDMRKHITYLS
ncbi:unnamed protein product [Commensalibacter communis]|uniref:hypothetical protein n=1 Tax=Commensalibacter communis TaxID=2972786 RepID=UPI0022FF61D9|nr:hypothetical protein [Commensalibacter communis]CAI3938439.1 unnamed protein product [Commensalibacter communis]